MIQELSDHGHGTKCICDACEGIRNEIKKTMDVDTLLSQTVKTLSLNRELLDEYGRELHNQLKHTQVGEIVLAIHEIDQLMTQIRLYQMPACMSIADAEKYRKG